MWLFSTKSKVNCHFCSNKLTLISSNNYKNGKSIENNNLLGIGNKNEFRCLNCNSLNKFNSNGEIQSDSNYNINNQSNNKSFSSSPTTTLTSSSSSSSSTTTLNPFCRNCLTNQSLQIHLLASFDFDDNNNNSNKVEKEEERISIPEYKSSLNQRYPIICNTCLPEVTKILNQRNYSAKTKMLGFRLNNSFSSSSCSSSFSRRGFDEKKVGKGRFSVGEDWNWKLLGFIWNLRKFLWWLTQFVGILSSLALFLSTTTILPPIPLNLLNFLPIEKFSTTTTTTILHSPITTFLSFLWNFWDPSWDYHRKELARGRKIDSLDSGRNRFIFLCISYLVRFNLSLLYYFGFLTSTASLTQPISLASFILLTLLLISSMRYMKPTKSTPILIRPSGSNDLSSSNSSSSSLCSSPGEREEEDAGEMNLVPLSSLSISTSPFKLLSSTSSATSINGGNSNLRERTKNKKSKKSLFPLSFSTSSTNTNSRLNSSNQPIFGTPSFTFSSQPANDSYQQQQNEEVEERDPNTTMDWEPISISPSSPLSSPHNNINRNSSKKTKSSFTLGPQRFFNNKKETGLEKLFEDSLIVDESDMVDDDGDGLRKKKGGGGWFSWFGVGGG